MTEKFPIELKNVGVKYRLHKEKAFSIKESVISSVKNILRVKREKNYRDLWAIRNINISIPRGMCMGLTGRNGSGKSTTLKVISGVLHPTEGELWVRGRVSALIELGAGFDSELTGRENIFLGASVAGLSRKEAFTHVDRIIEFSELKDFIDVPVKNYSSGMYARLGFALATDINPDILIVDEILAVGDASFQAKCIERMRDFKKRGKTILFVSHDERAVQSFCDQSVQLDWGVIVAKYGRPAENMPWGLLEKSP